MRWDGTERQDKVGEMLTMALHDAQELHHNLGGRADEHLAFAATLRVDDVVLPVAAD